MSDSSTCKNCKFWRQSRECERVEYVYEHGSVFTYGDSENTVDSDFKINIDVLDDSGLDVVLLTGPNFGCIKFEKKKEN